MKPKCPASGPEGAKPSANSLVVRDYTNIPLWTGNTDISVGKKMRYGGRIYELAQGDNTGVKGPHRRD